MLKEIYYRLGLETNIKEEKEKFRKRILILLNDIQAKCNDPTLSIEGISVSPSIIRNEVNFGLGEQIVGDFSNFIKEKSFEEILKVCEIFLSVLRDKFENCYNYFRDNIRTAIEYSVLDLGVTFEKDKFRKKGAEELDKSLILEPLDWIKTYPYVKELFNGALVEYFKKEYPDAITKSYSALESLTRKFLNSNKTLENLKPDLLRALNLPDGWRGILNNYCLYAHAFASRHGKKEDRRSEPLNPINVEAYIYMTGLIIRLIIQSIEKNKS